jgi:UDP-N-acetylglucosamine diphosphorylase/glucosamine-1-phosphate N-acetyltransferase
MDKELSIVILAAGKGTRMNSDLPKVLHKLNGKPLLDHVLDESELLNPREIILVVGFKKEHVISHTKNRINLKNVTQIEQLGTGHAVLQTEEFLKDKKGHILILYGDVPNIKASTLEPIIDDHIKNNRDLTLITAELDDPTGYGRIIRDKNARLLKIVEEKDCNDNEKKIKEWNPGIYIFKIPEVFEILNSIKANNASKEYYLTDAIGLAQQSNLQIKAIKIANSDEVLGINTAGQLEELES